MWKIKWSIRDGLLNEKVSSLFFIFFIVRNILRLVDIGDGGRIYTSSRRF